MNIHTYILKASGGLNPFVNLIEEVAQQSINTITHLIPISDVDIVLLDDPEQTISEIGVGGYTPNSHLIYISLNPTLDDFEGALRKHLPRSFAHELHHALRWRNPGYGDTLLEAMVTEGLADHFVIEATKDQFQRTAKATYKLKD